MKDAVSMLEVNDELECSSTFHRIMLTEPSDAARKQFADFKAKFFQALVDNLSARFSGSESLLKNVRVLENGEGQLA